MHRHIIKCAETFKQNALVIKTFYNQKPTSVRSVKLFVHPYINLVTWKSVITCWKVLTIIEQFVMRPSTRSAVSCVKFWYQIWTTLRQPSEGYREIILATRAAPFVFISGSSKFNVHNYLLLSLYTTEWPYMSFYLFIITTPQQQHT